MTDLQAKLDALVEAEVSEAFTGQGGQRSLLVIHGDKCVEVFSNGYDQPTEQTWREAKAFAAGWNALATLTGKATT